MNNTLYKNLILAQKELKLNIKNKAGVYQLINLINGKTYVGSSMDLDRRLNEYLNILYITRNLKKGNSTIMNALLKYGYINFGLKILEIIEFEPNLSVLEKRTKILAREQYFLDLIKPEYNINKTAGSNLGRVYSAAVREKMSLAKKGKTGNKKGAILSLETKILMKENSAKSLGITMFDEKNNVLAKYNSIQTAAEETGISRNRISRCARGIRKQIIEKGRLGLKIYIFKYTNDFIAPRY